MKTLFLAVIAYAGYRLALRIGEENAARPLLLRDMRSNKPRRTAGRFPWNSNRE